MDKSGCDINYPKIYNYESFTKEISDQVGSDYTVLSEYCGSKKNIKIRHNVCGHEWITTPSAFCHKKRRCPKCRYDNMKYSISEFDEMVYKQWEGEYSLLSDYEKYNEEIKVRHCTCGNEFTTTPGSLLKVKTPCPVCFKINNTKTHVQFIDQMLEKNPTVKVIGTYTNTRVPVLCECLKCGDRWMKSPSQLLLGKKCDSCFGQGIILGSNDLESQRPDIASKLKDPLEATKYSVGSNKKAWFVCPNCGEEQYCKVQDVCNKGLNCHRCSDGFSYPNKFMYNILRQLNVEFDTEYSPEWIGKMKFDFLISLENRKYIIEMDGDFHYRNPYKKGNTIEETRRIDAYKDHMAEMNGITVVRINCVYDNIQNRFNSIRESVQKSQISEVFDLSQIDWDLCNQLSIGSRLLEACNLWNSNIKDIDHIANMMKVSYLTVLRYIQTGAKCGICSYDKKERETYRLHKSISKSIACCSKSVRCRENGAIYKSMKEAAKATGAGRGNIGSQIKGIRNYAGKLPDGTPCTWEIIDRP